MNEEEFKLKYQEDILPHSKNPYHFEEKEGAFVDAYNPLCGDHFKLYLNKSGDLVTEGYFHGFGCAISKASTSLLIKHIEGKEEKEIESLIMGFLALLEARNMDPLPSESLNSLAELRNFNGRMDCVKLSWEALLRELTKDK